MSWPGSLKACDVQPVLAEVKQALAGMLEVWPRDVASRYLEELGLHA